MRSSRGYSWGVWECVAGVDKQSSGCLLSEMRKLLPTLQALWDRSKLTVWSVGLLVPILSGFADDSEAQKQDTMENSIGMRFSEVADGVWMSVYETRVQDFAAFVDAGGTAVPGPSFEQGPDHPVVNVSWEDAQRFCLWLTGLERASGSIAEGQFYRLPTEEEWVRAAGLDTSSVSGLGQGSRLIFAWGESWPPPPGVGNFDPKLGIETYECTAPVGSFPVNENGFYDLSGNVWEWCADTFEGVSDIRVLKGASWRMREPSRLALNRRIGNACGLRLPTYGFRVVLATEKPEE